MPMTSRALTLRRVAILGFGWLFVVLGVLGLFLPFLQGVLFLLVGLYLLSLESARARLFRQKLLNRYPRLAQAMDHARAFIHRLRERVFGRGERG
jgi:uncharacterized membrane protein YbaN (DUF454 family)